MKKQFYIEDYYISTKNDDNWDAIKWMLDLPIWERTNKKPSKDYKEYKRELKEIKNKKRRTDKQKEEYTKELDGIRAKSMDEIVTTTHRTFLRAFGDLMCERGDPTSISAPAIENKFMELAVEEYDNYIEDRIQIISKRIEKSKLNDEDKKKLINKERKKIKQRIKKLEKKHLSRVKQMTGGTGLKPNKKIDSLNNWLQGNRPSLFIKKVGENYKLLVYYAVSRQEIEYFCSDKNRDKFLGIINNKLGEKRQFEEIEYIKPFINILKPAPEEKIEYFRVLGPLKEHFEKGLMYRSDKIKILKEKIENSYNIQLLTGDTASGKTVISRNIGYELMNEGWRVYDISVHDLKDENKRANVRKGIDYLEKIANKVLIIIEDVHEGSDDFASFLGWIMDKCSKNRYLLTAWKSYDFGLSREGKFIFKKCEKIVLEEAELSSVEDNIITIYFKNQANERKNSFEEYKTTFRSRFRSKSGGNLWVLSYLLEAWDPKKGIRAEIVYDKIKKDIDDLEREFRIKYKLKGVPETLLALAPLSAYNIRVPHSFLDEEFGIIKINSNTLDKLIKYGKIKYENGFYSISHSTIAMLYMHTALFKKNGKNYQELLFNLTNQLKKNGFSSRAEEYPSEIVKAYIQTNPNNLVDNLGEIGFMMSFGSYFRGFDEEKLTVISIKNILKDGKTIEVLSRELKDGNDTHFIHFLGHIHSIAGACLDACYHVPDSVFFSEKDATELIMKTGGLDRLVSIFNNKETNVEDLESCLMYLHFRYIDEFHPLFTNQINRHQLKNKIKKETALLSDATSLMTRLCEYDKNFVKDLKDIISFKVKIGISLKDFGDTCDYLNLSYGYEEIDENLRDYLVNLISPDYLFSEFEKQKKLVFMSHCFPHIKRLVLSDKHMQHIANILSSKINLETDPYEIFECLSRVAYLGKDFSNMVVDNIDNILLKSKIGVEERGRIRCIADPFDDFTSTEDKIDSVTVIFNRLNLWEYLSERYKKELDRIINKKS